MILKHRLRPFASAAVDDSSQQLRRTFCAHNQGVLLERLVLFGEKALRKAVREFMTHYHSERNQQGIGNLLILSDRLDTNRRGPVRCRQRLGGMLNYYERAA